MIERGDRIALVGLNGAGKSTLIRLLARNRPPGRGRPRSGPQRRARLLRAGPVQGTRPGAHRGRGDVGRQLDHDGPDDPQPPGLLPVRGRRRLQADGVLSGGERNRLALAKMLLTSGELAAARRAHQPPRPRSKDVLLDALADYDGTVVFVSHDRYFIDKLATQGDRGRRRRGARLPRQLRGLPVLEEISSSRFRPSRRGSARIWTTAPPRSQRRRPPLLRLRPDVPFPLHRPPGPPSRRRLLPPSASPRLSLPPPNRSPLASGSRARLPSARCSIARSSA